MNKRIEDLINVCTEKVPYYPVDNDGNPEYSVVFNKNKFAELIIKECMMICGAIQGAGEFKGMPDFASGAAKCKTIIKQDFGIEE